MMNVIGFPYVNASSRSSFIKHENKPIAMINLPKPFNTSASNPTIPVNAEIPSQKIFKVNRS